MNILAIELGKFNSMYRFFDFTTQSAEAPAETARITKNCEFPTGNGIQIV